MATTSRPQRPYKNLEAFRRRILLCPNSWDKRHPNKWPCLLCGGRGWDYHPGDQIDPVEGSRHRRHCECPDCLGSGEGPRKAVLEAYRKEIGKYEIAKHKYIQLEGAKKKALAKLTKEEILALKLLGV